MLQCLPNSPRGLTGPIRLLGFMILFPVFVLRLVSLPPPPPLCRYCSPDNCAKISFISCDSIISSSAKNPLAKHNFCHTVASLATVSFEPGVNCFFSPNIYNCRERFIATWCGMCLYILDPILGQLVAWYSLDAGTAFGTIIDCEYSLISALYSHVLPSDSLA